MDIRELCRFIEKGFLLSDPNEGGHGLRVANYAKFLSRAVGVDDETLQKIEYGSRLHDIGKMLIGDGILSKVGRLSEAEWFMMQSHTVLGHRWVKPFEIGIEIENVIRWHHERLDGTGYPDQKKRLQIPVYVQIISIADAYDGLTSIRPYRIALSRGEAIQTMRNEVGHFDKELLETFATIIMGITGDTSPVPNLFDKE